MVLGSTQLLDEHGEQVLELQDRTGSRCTRCGPFFVRLEQVTVFDQPLRLPCPAQGDCFLAVFDALGGKYCTPAALGWDEEEDPAMYPDVRRLLPVLLSNAVDRPERLTLVQLRVDAALLDTLRIHARVPGAAVRTLVMWCGDAPERDSHPAVIRPTDLCWAR